MDKKEEYAFWMGLKLACVHQRAWTHPYYVTLNFV